MSSITYTILTICVVLVVSELICKYAPKNDALKFIGGLVAMVLMISVIAEFQKIEFKPLLSETEYELYSESSVMEYLDGEYQAAVQTETVAYIQGLLGSAEIYPKEIKVFTDKNEEGSILIEKIKINVGFESEVRRARALLSSVLKSEVETEVEVG